MILIQKFQKIFHGIKFERLQIPNIQFSRKYCPPILEKKEKKTHLEERLENLASHKVELYPYYKSSPLTLSICEFQKRFGEKSGPELENDKEKYEICGRVKFRRDLGKIIFYELNMSGNEIQIRWKKSKVGANLFEKIQKTVRIHDILSVHGHGFLNPKSQLCFEAEMITILSPCLQKIPLKLLEKNSNRYLRERSLFMITNQSLLKSIQIRAFLLQNLRKFLHRRNFIEVETPILSNHVGGAIAKPFETHANCLENEKLSLRISPELFLKQLIIGGLERIFEIGKVFRNENLDATHHPEFTTCEFYQAFTDYETTFAYTEQFLSTLICDFNRAFCGKKGDDFVLETFLRCEKTNELIAKKIDFTPPFQRISIPVFLKNIAPSNFPFLDPQLSSPEKDLLFLHSICDQFTLAKPPTLKETLDLLISQLIEPKCENPTFLCDHPLLLSPLAKKHPAYRNFSAAARFELFIQGVEICNSYTELNDPFEQHFRFFHQHHQNSPHFSPSPPSSIQNSATLDNPNHTSLQHCM
eukprot:Sdes_comp20351_c0_seq1m14124